MNNQMLQKLIDQFSRSCRGPYGQATHSETGENDGARYPTGRLSTQETYGQLPLTVGRPARALRDRREQSLERWRPTVNFLARSGDRREH